MPLTISMSSPAANPFASFWRTRRCAACSNTRPWSTRPLPTQYSSIAEPRAQPSRNPDRRRFSRPHPALRIVRFFAEAPARPHEAPGPHAVPPVHRPRRHFRANAGVRRICVRIRLRASSRLVTRRPPGISAATARSDLQPRAGPSPVPGSPSSSLAQGRNLPP